MPYQSNLLGDFWTSYRQRRATGGRPFTSREMRGLLDPMLQVDFQRGEAAAERQRVQGNIDRQFGLQERQLNAQDRAASVGGVTDLLGLGLSYKLGNQQNQLLQGFLGGGSGAANAAVQAAPAANFGQGILPGSQALGQVGGVSPALQEGGVSNLLSTGGIGSIASQVGMGAGAGLLGSGVLQKLGVNKDISESLGYTAAGFAVGGPVGAAIGFGVSLLDDIGDFFGGLF